MKNLIFCFTSTGNSLKIARDIAAKLDDTVITGITKTTVQKKEKFFAETIGFILPVYCWGLPAMVIDFIRAAQFNAKYVYAVATYGGCPGDTLLQLKKELAAKGIILSAGFGIRMPGNYTPLYGAIAAPKQQKYFAQAAKQIPDIVATIEKKNAAPVAWGPWIASAILRITRFYNLFISHVRESDKSFLVQDTCDGCGICAKVCPADNIRLQDKKPVWQHACENCLACLQWCPQAAIQYGKSTIGRQRYHHPDIAVKDLLAQKA